MASASSSAQAAFGLGRRKKNPGLLDQIGKFFGGDKKRKSKVRKAGRRAEVTPDPPSSVSQFTLLIPTTTFFFFTPGFFKTLL